ncbi:MAG: nitrate/nitrite transporter [Elainellaceae cyanobacterium]
MNLRTRLARQVQTTVSELGIVNLLAPDYPFSPRAVPVFYGWVILAVATIGILMSIPGQTAGVSVFTDPLLEALGISRLTLSNAYLMGTLTSGLLLPLGGTLIDRLGARVMVILASLWLAGTLCYLSLSDRLAQLLTALIPVLPDSAVALTLLMIGFTSLRFSGQGMLTLVSRTMLGKWFNRRRGFASGTSGIFTAFGFSAAPLILSLLIDAFSWRGAWLVLAAVVGTGMGLIGWLFYRDNPEACGLEMDGLRTQQPAADGSQFPVPPQMHEFTRGEALRTLAFWGVTLALSTQALTITGITFHIVDIGATVGLPERQIVAIFLPIAIFSTVVGYLIGIASDRMHLKTLFLGMMVFEAIGVASMAHLGTGWVWGLAIVGLGVSGGCFGTLAAVALPRYFGRLHLGSISGIQMMSMVIASAIGPSLLAAFKEVFASYQIGLYVAASLPLMVFVLLLFMRNPQR